MARDEVVDAQAHGPRAAVLVMALEVDRVLAVDDPARLREQKAVGLGRARRPGVDDHAVAVLAVPERHRATAFDPGFGLLLRGQGPAQEAVNLVVAVDREAVGLAIDLAGENARPVAEPQLGEGWLGHQAAHRQTERDMRVRGWNTLSPCLG